MVDIEGVWPSIHTLQGAIKSGDRLDELRAIRSVIAGHIDNPDTSARDLAPLIRHARDISKEIEELEAQAASLSEIESQEVDGDDDRYTFDPAAV